MVNILGFKPDGIVSGNTYITITATPRDDSVIRPLRNAVIDIGDALVTAIPDINLANSTVGTTS